MAPTGLTYGDMDVAVQRFFLPKSIQTIFTTTPLLTWLLNKGKLVASGGSKISQDITYEELAGGSYKDMDVFNTSYVETDTMAEWDYKNVYVNVTIPGPKERRVRATGGAAKVFDLVGRKMEIATKSMQKKLAQQLANDGSGNGGLDVEGLYKAIDDGVLYPTYGGISRTSNAWWKAYVNSTGGVLTSSLLQSAMGQVTDGPEAPDLILMRQTLFNKLWNKVHDKQIFQSAGAKAMASIGFPVIEFNGAAIMVDNYITPATSIYLLNTEYVKFVVLKTGNFIWTEPKEPTNQSAYVRQYLVDCNLVVTNPMRCARIDNVS